MINPQVIWAEGAQREMAEMRKKDVVLQGPVPLRVFLTVVSNSKSLKVIPPKEEEG